MQDGSPVPMNVNIQRVCSGISRTVAYTDSGGRFSFQWGDRNMILSDASDAGFNTNRQSNSTGFGGSQSAGGANALAADPYGSRMMNCELRANVGGYTSDSVNLFNRRATDSPDVGMIVLRRIAGVEGTSISATSMLAPKDARKAYEHGLQSILKNKPEEAQKDFEKAVAIYPKYADAWMNLGKLRLPHAPEEAKAALSKAIECDPKLVAPYVELGILAAQKSQWAESASYLDRAVRLDPVDYPQAWYADAVANYNLKKYDAAERSARESMKLDPKRVNPRSEYLLGLVLAEKLDYAGAATQISNYIQFAPNAPDVAQAKQQLAEVQKLIGGPAAATATPPPVAGQLTTEKP
jgi:tetratricopeptide (TPR) repeat protein